MTAKQDLNFEMKKLISRVPILLFVISAVALSGCPDRSHQRPVPDYQNMTDQGGEVEEVTE